MPGHRDSYRDDRDRDFTRDYKYKASTNGDRYRESTYGDSYDSTRRDKHRGPARNDKYKNTTYGDKYDSARNDKYKNTTYSDKYDSTRNDKYKNTTYGDKYDSARNDKYKNITYGDKYDSTRNDNYRNTTYSDKYDPTRPAKYRGSTRGGPPKPDYGSTLSTLSSPYDHKMASRQTHITALQPTQRQEQEIWAQAQLLRNAGACVVGFAWQRSDGRWGMHGYCCRGGSHFATDALLAEGRGRCYLKRVGVGNAFEGIVQWEGPFTEGEMKAHSAMAMRGLGAGPGPGPAILPVLAAAPVVLAPVVLAPGRGLGLRSPLGRVGPLGRRY